MTPERSEFRMPRPHLSPVDDARWVLDHDYVVRLEDRRITVVLRRGLFVDGTSVPRPLWRVFGHPLQGLALPGSLVHDYCYRTHLVPRVTADAWAWSLWLANGVWWSKALAMWVGIRAGGSFSWRQPRGVLTYSRTYIDLRRD